MNNNYYVYVYIDPRNLEEFYYGKGKGNRKESHLTDDSDSEKSKIIKSIKKDGLEPIIKVIARGLTEKEAFLVEKTLIWKLGKNLANLSSGHFTDLFRPHKTLHLNLNGYDYENGVYYVNVGEGDTRCWEDCKKFGFLAAGQLPKWSDPMRTLNPRDIVVAYLKGKGYVGIGKVTEEAKRAIDFKFRNKSLSSYSLEQPNIFQNSNNKNSEYLVKIKWLKSVPSNEAKWKAKANLFTTQLIKASLEKQVKTIDFLEKEFDVSFEGLMME